MVRSNLNGSVKSWGKTGMCFVTHTLLCANERPCLYVKRQQYRKKLFFSLINCLLFADNVVLLANTPDELKMLLQISQDFASKWNLKSKAKKSKVTVIGKRLQEKSNWVLGDKATS